MAPMPVQRASDGAAFVGRTARGQSTSPSPSRCCSSRLCWSRRHGNRIRLVEPDPAATSGSATATVATQYAYDSADRLCRVVEHATGTTDLQDLDEPCTDSTQTSGTTTHDVSTRYTYDGAGNLATMIDAAGHTTTYGYDAAGQPTSRTDALAEVLVWSYDDLGRQVSQENRSDPPYTDSITWTHDGGKRPTSRKRTSERRSPRKP